MTIQFHSNFHYIAAYNSATNEVTWPSHNISRPDVPEISCFSCRRAALTGNYTVTELKRTGGHPIEGLVVCFPHNVKQNEEECVVIVATLLGLMSAAEE